MKKLSTLLLVLLVTVVGYSQIQSQPNMLRSVGELDYTTYDWQTNWGNINRTIVWPDGKVSFAYTYASASNFSDRGTAIGTYDSNCDEWIPMGGRIEIEKCGFGSIARYKDNGIVVASHTDTQCGIYIIEDKDNMVPNSVPCAIRMDPTFDPAWPVVITSGVNRDIIHVVATGYSDNNLYYFRSRDGLTWDVQNVVLPYLTPEYGSSWGSNVAYWMETTEDNCLALVINNTWSDGMVLYSYDDGETWERKVFYHHPGINTTFADHFFYPRWASCIWNNNGKLCVAYEFNAGDGAPGSTNYEPGIGGIAFWSETMPYHGETMPTYGSDPTNPLPPMPGQPFIMDHPYINYDIYETSPYISTPTHERWPEYFGYIDEVDPNGQFILEDFSLHGGYNCGPCAMPVLCKVPGFDNGLVAVWIALDLNYMDANGNYYFKVYASCSDNGGRTWFPQIELTDDFMYSYTEFVYPQAAIVGHTLIVACQADETTGTVVQGGDNDPDDNLYLGFTFDLFDLYPYYGTKETEHNTHITVYPNPAFEQLKVTLNKNAEVTVSNVMGQALMTAEGHVGVNTIDISNLNSGIYFINAGNDTQKFIVK